ncbi:hypothetical protein SAMN02910414_02441 [Lachnobacterium bovis DSM 14045]|uniref:Uncharacterized protein n=2 Tax=Lachnobacterium bovis TaxID=140626 RepID=A0A1H3MZJ1_9FIRM|nr:hypothetical protein SAMN02910414_02441 [Lachnobacterium bovis DSM 14045]
MCKSKKTFKILLFNGNDLCEGDLYLMAKVIHKKGSEELAKLFLETYDPQSSDDVQNSFKDMIGTVFEALLQGELTDHLGFENNDHSLLNT